MDVAAHGEVEARADGARAPKSKPRRDADVRRKYDFAVIRALRQKRGLTIQDFAKLCGLSYAPISRIETNHIKPNLETLDKIAAGLGVSTHALIAMAEKRGPERVRGKDRRAGPFVVKAYSCDGIEVLIVSAKKGSQAQDLSHEGRAHEIVVVERGSVDVFLEGKPFRVNAGEALNFDGQIPRRYTAVEDVEMAIVLTSRS